MSTNDLAYPRLLGWTLLALAGITLATALTVICVRAGSAWPWSLVVHEDGVRTLLGTILYFEHATRELPLDILLGVAIGGSVYFAFPPESHAASRHVARRVATLAAIAMTIVAVIVVGTTIFAGPPSVLENILQKHTRMGAALLWGAHWRYHLLERLALILLVIGFAGLLRLVNDGGNAGAGKAGMVVAGGTIGIYLAFTAVFAHGPLSMLQPFRDPQYLGHQARELFTHALVTVPIGWGVCMFLLPRESLNAASRSLSWPAAVTGTVITALFMGGLGVLMAGYVGFAALHSDAVSLGQSKDLATLIFPHFFEHSFSYLVVPAVAGLTYELMPKPAVAGPTRAGKVVAGVPHPYPLPQAGERALHPLPRSRGRGQGEGETPPPH